MSIMTLVIGESGHGKSRSIKGLLDKNPLIVQAANKAMPFRSRLERVKQDKDGKLSGNLFSTREWSRAKKAIYAAAKDGRSVIVIDDFQYLMADEFMRRAKEGGFTKFTELAQNVYDFIRSMEKLPDDVRVYFLSHLETEADGRQKIKTIGKLLDEKITIEGLFPIVLKAKSDDGRYFFITQTSGLDTCKSPEGMFDEREIENDLGIVDDSIVDYYGLQEDK